MGLFPMPLPAGAGRSWLLLVVYLLGCSLLASRSCSAGLKPEAAHLHEAGSSPASRWLSCFAPLWLLAASLCSQVFKAYAHAMPLFLFPPCSAARLSSSGRYEHAIYGRPCSGARNGTSTNDYLWAPELGRP